MTSLAVVDLARPDDLAPAIDAACSELGFFLVTGHGVDPALLRSLEDAARRFFALPEPSKAAIAMARGGRAWRGWFPFRGELTSGVADDKEGLYFGTELPADNPRVRAGTPLHGSNLFPTEVPDLRPAVLATMSALTGVATRILAAMAVALGLPPDWFATHLTADPTILFRIFRYPPAAPEPEQPDTGKLDAWGVREHTDYGLVTVLAHDGGPGLEVHGLGGWVTVDAPRDMFVINLGDMLEKLTDGRWRSTPHRVRNPTRRDRLSFPLFCDPGWEASVPSLPVSPAGARAGRRRWDAADPLAWHGTYGEYLTAKVAKVFPHLTD